MHADGQLPRGLDPVRAGRIGLWSLSQRSHRAAKKRVAFPNRVWPETLVCRFIVHEYAGSRVVLSHILGVAPLYARNLMKPSHERRLPPKHACRLADYLLAHAAECDALARELRVSADGGSLAKKSRRS